MCTRPSPQLWEAGPGDEARVTRGYFVTGVRAFVRLYLAANSFRVPRIQILLAPTELAVLFELLASKFMLIQCKNIGQQAVFSLGRLGAISTPPGLYFETDCIMDKAVSARMHDADH